MDEFNLTPSPALLDLLGRIPFKGWQCVAELIDNSIDAIIGKNSDLKDMQKAISISVPTKGKIESNEPLVVEDWGSGMTDAQLENAVRAGFSNKSTSATLGLFGMGFNVATSRLANTVEVWTSTNEMTEEIGVRIDLKEMKKHGSFIRPKLTRPKGTRKSSGTQIKIFDYKPETQNLLKPPEVIRELNRAYSDRIFNKHGIKIFVNQTEIKPFEFCIWSPERSARYKSEDVPAVIEVDHQISEELFCESCYSWIGISTNTSLQIQCPHCLSSEKIVKKQISLVGWVGIQRYTDTEHFGIDISRNGRILSRLDKTFFSWNKNGENDWRLNPEYPRDTPHAGGRIVGQIEANFIIPKYTKDDFERDDKNWIKALDCIRGEMPLQPDLAAQFNYPNRNRSPIGLLFSAYRKPSPPGSKTLIFGKSDGSADYITPKNWAQKFYDGDIEYQDDTKWWQAVCDAELRGTSTGFNPLDPLSVNKQPKGHSGHIPESQKEPEKFPGKKLQKFTRRFDLEKLINEKPIDITAIDYFPDIEIPKPIIFDPQGPNRFFVYLNNNHPLFRDFADGYEDLIYMEVAAKFSALKSSDDWPISRLYYELKSRYAAETMLSVPNLVNRANELMRKIQNYLVYGDGVLLNKKPSLTDSDIKALEKKYLDIENAAIQHKNLLLMNSKYLRYLDLNYVFKFIQDFPELIFDGKVFNLPYAELDDENKTSQLKKYLSYFEDVRWFMNELSIEGDETIKKMKSQIIRNRISIEILHGSISK